MVAIKLKNVSVKNADKFRNNQNYTLTLFEKKDGITKDSSIEEIREVIINKFSNILKLNTQSIITISN